MIIDICKPLNEGEQLTVRIIMTVDEARIAITRPHDDLLRSIKGAIARHDGEKIVDGWQPDKHGSINSSRRPMGGLLGPCR